MTIDDEICEYMLIIIDVMPLIHCFPNPDLKCGSNLLDARFQNTPLGGFKHVECLCGTPGIVSLLKTWFFQLCMMASTLFWSNSMDTFNGLIVLRIHF